MITTQFTDAIRTATAAHLDNTGATSTEQKSTAAKHMIGQIEALLIANQGQFPAECLGAIFEILPFLSTMAPNALSDLQQNHPEAFRSGATLSHVQRPTPGDHALAPHATSAHKSLLPEASLVGSLPSAVISPTGLSQSAPTTRTSSPTRPLTPPQELIALKTAYKKKEISDQSFWDQILDFARRGTRDPDGPYSNPVKTPLITGVNDLTPRMVLGIENAITAIAQAPDLAKQWLACDSFEAQMALYKAINIQKAMISPAPADLLQDPKLPAFIRDKLLQINASYEAAITTLDAALQAKPLTDITAALRTSPTAQQQAGHARSLSESWRQGTLQEIPNEQRGAHPSSIMKNKHGKPVGVFKPILPEEVTSKKEAALEVLTAHWGALCFPSLHVPSIAMATSPTRTNEMGSLQAFATNVGAVADLPGIEEHIETSSAQAMAAFHIVTQAGDVQDGNILVSKSPDGTHLIAIPIDNANSCGAFGPLEKSPTWVTKRDSWPQMRTTWDPAIKQAISQIDLDANVHHMQAQIAELAQSLPDMAGEMQAYVLRLKENTQQLKAAVEKDDSTPIDSFHEVSQTYVVLR